MPDAQQEKKDLKEFLKKKSELCSNQSLLRKQYTPLRMTSALNAVLENGVSANKAAAMHGVPQSPLKDRLSGCVKHGNNPGPKRCLN